MEGLQVCGWLLLRMLGEEPAGHTLVAADWPQQKYRPVLVRVHWKLVGQPRAKPG
jgi:hypothetical protein